MKILGIHDGHNAAASLLIDGVVVHAIQEERIRREKNWSGFPEKAIQWILREANLTPSDFDSVVLNGNYIPKPIKSREDLLELYKNTSKSKGLFIKLLRKSPLMSIYRKKRHKERVQNIVNLGFNPGIVETVNHHLCHASTAYYGLGNYDEKILVFTCDGSGDGLSGSLSIGENGKLTKLTEISEDDSIGNVFAVVTFLLGMVPLEHEYKMMGMAPYADSRGVENVYNKLMEHFYFEEEGDLKWKTKGMPPTFNSYKFIRDLFEYERFDGIMGGVQLFCEDILKQWVANGIKSTGIKKIALSGGVFMNVKANKVLMEMPEVESIFIYPSCGDETNAMGASYHKYAQVADYKNIKPINHVYFGKAFSNDAIKSILESYSKEDISFEYLENIEKEAAKLLAAGEVVARFAGKEEFGARSLGNRAILGNPSQKEVIKIINEMVKNRDFWMPFACSILVERQYDYIKNPKNVDSSYMILSFDSVEESHKKIYAGTHPYDRTVRPQVVKKEDNQPYHTLISEFEKITGVGALLNTSFNLHGYPIVSEPQNAIDVLLKSGLRYVIVENYLVKKL